MLWDQNRNQARAGEGRSRRVIADEKSSRRRRSLARSLACLLRRKAGDSTRARTAAIAFALYKNDKSMRGDRRTAGGHQRLGAGPAARGGERKSSKVEIVIDRRCRCAFFYSLPLCTLLRLLLCCSPQRTSASKPCSALVSKRGQKENRGSGENAERESA